MGSIGAYCGLEFEFADGTVIGFAGRRGSQAYFNRRCDCGREKPVSAWNLMRTEPPMSRSCGCIRRSLMQAKMRAAHSILATLTEKSGDRHNGSGRP
jgi:hypothetical protein